MILVEVCGTEFVVPLPLADVGHPDSCHCDHHHHHCQ